MSGAALPTARGLGLKNCHACGRVSRGARHCPRCGGRLHSRKPDSLNRTVALLLAASLLYIPANVLPVLHTSNLFESESHTILGGVVELWVEGSPDLAIIVFVASIMVPIIKIGVLTLLVACTALRSDWRLHERAQMYRIVERIGHWSMLDVFVVALLVALVRFRSLGEFHAEPGIFAFGAVVVLTMLASMSFDPRLMWDHKDDHEQPH